MTRAARDRTLVLLRHAKTEESNPGGDHDRELTGRGRRDAAEAGRWLCREGIGIDEVLCSTAERTRQTCEVMWEAGCSEGEVRYDRRIYGVTPEVLLDVVREADDDADVVMVVGHAPGIPVLAELLADGEGSADGHRAMAEGFPTCALAVLHYAGRWADLTFGDARLDRFHVARGGER
ncbi:SixA phosphatase family protein [Phycicoccus duodecadis]|uniref:Phosphohistidine phosphatase n=1 Tax=Phycicoccus duodecadis TaxID=173053 RepID=A0A2N3YGH9_9MICO|nr:histidine phosphatase family protein [Phycicoccus duodecadis]PKW25951.1 phosphohistidine phosphatase [Phycicoccus duodecadis]